jgi:hypothetical protein
MLDILNKILGNQIDPNAVMSKLDEIQNDIQQIKDQQGWPNITDQQAAAIRAALIPFVGQQVHIEVDNGDENRLRLANELKAVMKSAGWNPTINTATAFFPPDTDLPQKIILQAKEATPAANSLLIALAGVFGKDAIDARLEKNLSGEFLQVAIWYKPK